MQDYNNVSNDPSTEIVDIKRKKNGKYEVYFKFLSIPVIMNRGYLDTLLASIKGDNLSFQLA